MIFSFISLRLRSGHETSHKVTQLHDYWLSQSVLRLPKLTSAIKATLDFDGMFSFFVFVL